MDKIDYRETPKRTTSPRRVSVWGVTPFMGVCIMIITTVILVFVISCFVYGATPLNYNSTNPNITITIKDKYIDISDNYNEYYVLDTNNEIYWLKDYTDTKGNVIKMYNLMQVNHTYNGDIRIFSGNDRRIDVNTVKEV